MCCSPWGRKESNMAELLNGTEVMHHFNGAHASCQSKNQKSEFTL